jgi:hypothetical protein
VGTKCRVFSVLGGADFIGSAPHPPATAGGTDFIAARRDIDDFIDSANSELETLNSELNTIPWKIAK